MSEQEYLSTQIENVDSKSPVDLCLKILGYGQREIAEETTILEIDRQLREDEIISDELKRIDKISELPKPKDKTPEKIIYIKSLKSNDIVNFQKGREILIKNDEEYQEFQRECFYYINDSNSKVFTIKCLTSPKNHFSIVLIEKKYYLF